MPGDDCKLRTERARKSQRSVKAPKTLAVALTWRTGCQCDECRSDRVKDINPLVARVLLRAF